MPSRLFDKSPRGMHIERSSRCVPGIFLGHQNILWFGGKADPVKNRAVIPAVGERPNPCTQRSAATRKTNRWYYHANSVVSTVDDCTRDWFHEFLAPGTVWTGNCDVAVHHSQRLAVKPLKSSDWPRDPLGPSWPSFPSIPEWMEMIRKGFDPSNRPELTAPVGNVGFTSVARRETSENPYLASAIVSHYVVGIRSSTEVPRTFLGYFRYSQNFLILMNTWSLPIGLVRFLLAQWCQKPYSLWLRRSVTFKKVLKELPVLLVSRARRRLDRVGQRPTLTPDGDFTSPPDSESDYESGYASDLD